MSLFLGEPVSEVIVNVLIDRMVQKQVWQTLVAIAAECIPPTLLTEGQAACVSFYLNIHGQKGCHQCKIVHSFLKFF